MMQLHVLTVVALIFMACTSTLWALSPDEMMACSYREDEPKRS
jgi:hypothetical protein